MFRCLRYQETPAVGRRPMPPPRAWRRVFDCIVMRKIEQLPGAVVERGGDIGDAVAEITSGRLAVLVESGERNYRRKNPILDAASRGCGCRRATTAAAGRQNVISQIDGIAVGVIARETANPDPRACGYVSRPPPTDLMSAPWRREFRSRLPERSRPRNRQSGGDA